MADEQQQGNPPKQTPPRRTYSFSEPLPRSLLDDLLESRIAEKDTAGAAKIGVNHPELAKVCAEKMVEVYRARGEYNLLLLTTKAYLPEKLPDSVKDVVTEQLKSKLWRAAALTIQAYAPNLEPAFGLAVIDSAIDDYQRMTLHAASTADLSVAKQLHDDELAPIAGQLGPMMDDNVDLRSYVHPITQEHTRFDPATRLQTINDALARRLPDPERYDLEHAFEKAIEREEYLLAKSIRMELRELPFNPVPLDQRTPEYLATQEKAHPRSEVDVDGDLWMTIDVDP